MSGISKNVFLCSKDISGDIGAGSQVCCPLKVKEGQHHLQSAIVCFSCQCAGFKSTIKSSFKVSHNSQLELPPLAISYTSLLFPTQP